MLPNLILLSFGYITTYLFLILFSLWMYILLYILNVLYPLYIKREALTLVLSHYINYVVVSQSFEIN